MDDKAFAAAKEKLALSRERLAEMKAAEDIVRLNRAWSEFLTEAQRVFTRMRKATNDGPSKGWFDGILNVRGDDDLLSYILHARNAEEHGIERITSARPGGLKVNIGGDGYVDSMKIEQKADAVKVTYRGKNPITFEPIAASVDLIAVLDRGIMYQPPKTHLGEKLSAVTPIAVAELAQAYLDKIMTEADEKFRK